MVGHWTVDYHRDIGVGTTFPDVSDNQIVVDAGFLDHLGNKVKSKDNYRAVAAGIKKVFHNGVSDFRERNCFIVVAKKVNGEHKLLFEIMRDQKCKLIGAECCPDASVENLKDVVKDLTGMNSFENVQLTI